MEKVALDVLLVDGIISLPRLDSFESAHLESQSNPDSLDLVLRFRSSQSASPLSLRMDLESWLALSQTLRRTLAGAPALREGLLREEAVFQERMKVKGVQVV